MTEQRNSTTSMMLVVILLFGYSLAHSSAYGQSKTAQPTDEKPVQVATYSSKSKKVGKIRKDLLKTAFEDGMQISDMRVDKQGDKFYLIRKGKAGSVSRISRTQLTVSENGALFIQTGGTTESCEGNPCSECAFAFGGGCECRRNEAMGFGACKHTIGRSIGIINSTK
jgi:hypothetical protein